MLNPWQIFWRSIDEARLVVRIMLAAIFAAVVFYVWFVTRGLFGIIHDALMQENANAWTNLAVILTAVTSFSGVTIPVLVGMFKAVWEDYRSSGVNWDSVSEHQKKVAEAAASFAAPAPAQP